MCLFFWYIWVDKFKTFHVKQQQNILNSPITNTALKPFLRCRDYTVSQEEFDIVYDATADFLATSPRPKSENLMRYYESVDYISHSDTKENILDKVYHLVRKYTIRNKVKRLRIEQPNGKTVLDIGCGTGDFLALCSKNNWSIYGVEPNIQAGNLAREKTGSEKIFSSISKLLENHKNKKFDIITLWHVLEHVPNLIEYINDLKKLLSPTGTLIIAVPNFKSYDATYYKKYWAAYDVPRHLWHFSPKAMGLLFEKVNMTVQKKLPMIFDAFYVSLLSEQYKNKKANFIKAIYIGLVSNLKALSTKQYSSLIYILKTSENVK